MADMEGTQKEEDRKWTNRGRVLVDSSGAILLLTGVERV